ncbi:MAG: HD-GYP domain-containing protein [Coriobacteriia bacterium]|nr:HD-GYP domain-containing protein [Coriobacteriia bacterium]
MRVRLYVLLVFAAAVAMAALAASATPLPDWGLVVFFGVLASISEWAAMTTAYGGTVSVSFALLFAALLLGGPIAGAAAALISAVAIMPRDLAEHRPAHRILFNAAMYPLMVLVAGWVLHAADVPALATDTALALDLASWLLSSILAAAALAAVNWLLVGIAVSLSTDATLGEVWRSEIRQYLVSFVSLTLLGVVLVQLVAVAGSVSVLLLAVPFFVARQTFGVSAEIAKAFKDTIRSLVAVLEAKDPYTRGHSERVAVYSRDVAEELGMSPSQAQGLELAALLHDIGKVGIAAATLGKPGSLTGDEFNEIRLHPITGSSILADIDFLKEVVPLIEAHHERLDGSGYPYGLRGEAVSLEARVLAVADCFDAMTSDRAYRNALSFETARDELLRGAGRKLDRRCVDALLARVSLERARDLADQEGAWRANR